MAIKSFRHKGLNKFFDTGSKAGIQVPLSAKIEVILDRLDAACEPKDMNFPGSNFHSLKGKYYQFYSVHVNGNWTIIFRFENDGVYDVDLIDYH